MEEEIKLPLCKRYVLTIIKDEERDYKIDDLRTVPKGTRIFSIMNQETFILTSDVVVKIKSVRWDSHFGFCSKMIRICDTMTESTSKDEWELNIEDTKPYIHENMFNYIDFSYKYNK